MLKERNSASGYRYPDAEHSHARAYLLPTVKAELAVLSQTPRQCAPPPRLFDLGCGKRQRRSASLAKDQGWARHGRRPIVGRDCSGPARPILDLRLEEGSAYDDLAAKYGRFPAVVISLEVVEHVYAFRATMREPCSSSWSRVGRRSSPRHTTDTSRTSPLPLRGRWTGISRRSGTMATSSSGPSRH